MRGLLQKVPRYGFHILGCLLLMAGPLAAQAPVEHGHEDHGEEKQGHGDGHGHGHGKGHDDDHHDYAHHSVHHDFSDAEMWSKRFDNPARDAWQKPTHVVELMAIEDGMTVADLGAGTGYFLASLASAVGAEGRVLGLDPEQGMVDFMVERASRQGLDTVEAKRIPFDSPGLADDEAHRILIVNTWHHIGNRRHYSTLLAQALAPGGAVYVVDFTQDSPSGPPVEARLLPEKVMEELAAGGLEVDLVDEDLPRQYVVRGRKAD